jgi:Phosphotransferase enzyme family
MILDVPRLVRTLIPNAPPLDRLSVACVRTTRPKYLVFDGNAAAPAYVVQFGTRDELHRSHQALSILSVSLPGMVPQSLACAPAGTDRYVQVQSGLPGVPWFRLADSCITRKDWTDLLTRCMGALWAFQEAVGEQPAWTGTIHPGRELRARLEAATGLRDTFTRAAGRISAWTAALDARGSISSTWQHGDFSLNNLLVAPSSVGVIDFDEFGDTMMPLHDEVGLALSVPLSQGGTCPLSVADCLDLCLQGARSTRQMSEECLSGLTLHHLLWRIERCQGWPTRDRVRAQLTAYVERLLADVEPQPRDPRRPTAQYCLEALRP